VKLTPDLHLVPRSENKWSYISTPQYVFMVRCLLKNKDNFALPEGRRLLGRPRRRWEDNSRVNVRSCEHGNETFGSMEGGEFLD
jgi:hypothetical protein